jgi:phosphate-selective porin OprO/OprP
MFRSFVFAALLVSSVAPAFAQAPNAAPPPTTGFDNGFFVQSTSGDYRLVFGLNLQIDGRFSLDDPLPITNTFTLRKARPTFSGRLTKYFEFKFMPDFGNGVTSVQDAYVDTRFSNALRLRVGIDKTPVGYELLMGDGNLFFAERSLASSLVPNRDIGFQGVGSVFDGKVSYSGGVFNGVPDAASSSTEVDTNSDKSLAGRIAVQPWRAADGQATALSGLGFHVGGSIGDESGALPTFKTSVGQAYFSYGSGVTANGRHTRVTPVVFYFYKPVGAFAEYVLSRQDVARAGLTQPIDNHAMNVTVVLSLTGEPVTTGITRPRQPFDPEQGHWGAVQVLSRYSHLEIDGDVFAAGLAAANASGRADQWTIALNWFPTAFTKWYATYERTTFDKNVAGARPIENVILFRAQLAF